MKFFRSSSRLIRDAAVPAAAWGAHAPSRAVAGALAGHVRPDAEVIGGGADDHTRGACAPRRPGQQGVALVITLILLSIITFMAVTFLVLSQRERGRVSTQASQTDAKNASDAALEQAKAQILARIIARNNGYDNPMFVSTNYINPLGYLPGALGIVTNVSYVERFGAPWSIRDYQDMLLNLQLLPRPPVFIPNPTNPAFPPEFRFYLDLNRNGLYDANGIGTNYVNGFVATNNNGNLDTNHFFTGDPEWIGVLDKPDQPHSGSNQFVARYAFIALPIGNSLDINFIHNQAKNAVAPSGTANSLSLREGYLRDEGYGSWELNLAAFLYYLNTNWWSGPAAFGPFYAYTNNANYQSGGIDFQDALSIVRYRYNYVFDPLGNNGVKNLVNSFNSIGATGLRAATAFGNDYIDGYSVGPVWATLPAPAIEPEPITGAVRSHAWPGADNPKHFFTTQDLFNYASDNQSWNFTNRLWSAGTNVQTSADRYTFYNLLSQMSFDSAPDTSGKININYDNINTNGAQFNSWTPGNFFNAAADKMLHMLAANVPASVATSNWYPATLSVTNIPIYPINWYTPAVHRMLQLAANIYDSTTNRPFAPGLTNYFPSVFRPTFGVSSTNIFINGYVEETNNSLSYQAIPFSLPEDAARMIAFMNANPGATNNVYGIPYVIGAKKGLPNFNEFSTESVSQITRRIQLDKRPNVSDRTKWLTNQLYIVGISNLVGIEAWNSYASAYARTVDIIAAVDLRMTLAITNSDGTSLIQNLTNPPALYVVGTNYAQIPANQWFGFNSLSRNPAVIRASFQIPVRSSVVFVPDSAYYMNPSRLVPSAGLTNDPMPSTTDLSTPHFVLTVTNHLRFIMKDDATGRIIDFVQLNGMDKTRDLTAEMMQNDPYHLWQTNGITVGGGGIPSGVSQQLQVCLGNYDAGWNAALEVPTSKSSAITGFSEFYNNQTNLNPNLVAQEPFTPTAKLYQVSSYQANDPLVHYTLADLLSGATNPVPFNVVPPNDLNNAVSNAMSNLRAINTSYHPWNYASAQGGPDPHVTDLTFKDPQTTGSDAWDFPTNKFPTIGWLGRVHRGTPWQTIYMKSSPITDTNGWMTWTGNGTNPFVALSMQPTNDWKLFDLFTTAPNDNASRGKLSINQTNLASWAAVLHGVTILSNTPTAGVVPLVIDPLFNDYAFRTVVAGINARRSNYFGGVFTNVGDILSVPELTVSSPFLATNSPTYLSDAVYERLPQQILSLLKPGEARYVIFCYGQSLRPADRSISQLSGPTFGICTNYQITGEVATRAVVHIENRPVPGNGPTQPQVIVDSFNMLPPE